MAAGSRDLGALRPVLDPALTRAFDLHRQAFANGDWLSAGVWGAVFLEGFLEEACTALGLATPQHLDLGAAISRLQQAKDLANGREVIEYATQVRISRNALVHARSTVGHNTETHARTIQRFLEDLLPLAEPWFARLIATHSTDAKAGLPVPIGRVFLSTITPHMPRQEGFLADLEIAMREMALEPVRCILDAYDKKDPIRPVLDTLKSCDALLGVGLMRSHAYFLSDRKGGAKEKEDFHRLYTSGWLHMEAGAAYALGKPVIVMCEERIASDGVFDRDWNSSPPFVMSSGVPSVSDPQVRDCLRRLQKDVLALKQAPN